MQPDIALVKTGEYYIVIGALSTVVISMAWYIVSIHKKYHQEQQENTRNMTQETTLTRAALENNTKAVDRVFDYMTRALKD